MLEVSYTRIFAQIRTYILLYVRYLDSTKTYVQCNLLLNVSLSSSFFFQKYFLYLLIYTALGTITQICLNIAYTQDCIKIFYDMWTGLHEYYKCIRRLT